MNLTEPSRAILAIFLFVKTSVIANRQRLLCFAVGSAVLFYLSLSTHLPLSVYSLAGYDDALFIRNAISILDGSWLGAYNKLTLAKGSAFPIFLAISSIAGLPVTFVFALLNLLAASLLVYELRRLVSNQYLLIVLWGLLLFHPALMPVRVIRDYIYPAFTIILVAGLIRCSHHESDKDSFMPIVIYGFFAGWFFLIREEGIWIAPIILIILIYRYLIVRHSGCIYHPILKAFSCFILSLLTPTVMISSVNYFLYDRFITQDFTNGSFVKVLGQLNSIVDERQIPYVLVSATKRAQVYNVSPSFLELKPLLENELKFWQSHGCAIYPDSCGDYAGGWFMWAFRDAVAQKGYYQSAAKADNFYKQMSDEINQACLAEKLICKSSLLPLIPAIPERNISKIIPKILEALEHLLLIRLPELTAGPSSEPAFILQDFTNFLGNPRIVPSLESADVLIRGWFYGPGAANQSAWLELLCSDGVKNIKLPVQRDVSPDLVKHFGDDRAGLQRFVIQLPSTHKCSLISTDTKNILPENLISSRSGAYPMGANTLYIDQKSAVVKNVDARLPLVIKKQIMIVYQWILTPVVVLGLFSFLWATIFFIFIKRSWPNLLYILAFSLWAVVISRLSILMLIELTSFPGITVLYMLPIYPLLILTSFFSICAVISRNSGCHSNYRNIS